MVPQVRDQNQKHSHHGGIRQTCKEHSCQRHCASGILNVARDVQQDHDLALEQGCARHCQGTAQEGFPSLDALLSCARLGAGPLPLCLLQVPLGAKTLGHDDVPGQGQNQGFATEGPSRSPQLAGARPDVVRCIDVVDHASGAEPPGMGIRSHSQLTT